MANLTGRHCRKTYIEWLLDIPWNICSEDHLNLKGRRKVLEEDHYGLEEVKERILEFRP